MSKHVLLADDEIHIIRAIEFKLKRADYQVRCAYDGQNAWELIQEFPPQLLITDFQMPRLNGLELVTRIRATPDICKLPIIMLTAKGFEMSVAETCQAYGLMDIMTKPFSPRQLFKRVDEILSSLPEPASLTTASTSATP